MPRQNRITPFGEIIATPERGTLMGNRGIIHDEFGRIRRSWLLKRWLLCVLEFKGRRRIVMAPNRYTELFFLDEATGLAAGHRPCAECQRKRYIEFRDAWAIGKRQALPAVPHERQLSEAGPEARPPAESVDSPVGQASLPADLQREAALPSRRSAISVPPTAVEIDDRLHVDRLGPSRSKRTYQANLDDLPDGIFVTRFERNCEAFLVLGSSLLAWSPGGYRERLRRTSGEVVSVLTPESSVAAIRAGFVPQIHFSARF